MYLYINPSSAYNNSQVIIHSKNIKHQQLSLNIIIMIKIYYIIVYLIVKNQ